LAEKLKDWANGQGFGEHDMPDSPAASGDSQRVIDFRQSFLDSFRDFVSHSYEGLLQRGPDQARSHKSLA
jgi:hypothetical protein